ncbi:inositol 1,4,5-trisphosphate-sensitive calcium-release channel [Aureococcus anophagefferens]|uniref:Inositol 1,4,5-trisphosphate-sensitive calcium-release channel n=1 Tax=Aureococcus anophagefferens TaxID=44056 RepID=A0ABR1FVQ3_AURAN
MKFLSADTRAALSAARRGRIFFDGARAADLRPQLRRTGADKDVDATGRELWLLEAAPPRAARQRAALARAARACARVSPAQYRAGPGGAARLLPAPDGASCDLVLERVARDRGGAGAAADASPLLRGNKANEFFFVEQEGGGWFLACIDQIAYSVGAAEALSQLVSDNEELLERHIDARRRRLRVAHRGAGPRADLLGFLGAICSCRGRGVKSNQELCAARLGSASRRAGRAAGRARPRRSAARSCCGSARGGGGLPPGPPVEWAATGAAPAAFLGESELRAGFSRAYASWTCPADGGAWEPRTSHLFWGPGRAGVRRAGGRVVLGLAVVSDGRGGAWVELGDLLWILEEDDAARDALCRDVVGCPYDEVYAAARGDEALRAGLARQKQLARYFVEQVRTLSEMVRTRSYKVARVVEKEWSYGLLVSSMVDARLPAAARAALVRLLHHLYLDRYPHEENCGKAQLPEQIVVVDPTSALYPQSDPALKDADATLRKSGYVDRRDSLNDDADFVAAERRAARRIRDFVAFPTSDKFHLVDAAVAAALRGDGRHTDDGAAYDGALLDALHALVSFGFCARMSDVAANAAALIGLLDARRRAVAPRLLPIAAAAAAEPVHMIAYFDAVDAAAAAAAARACVGALPPRRAAPGVAGGNKARGDILRGLGQRRTLADDGDTAGAAGAAAPPPSPRAVEDVRDAADPSRRRPSLIRKFLEPEKQYELEDVLVDLMLTESDALAAATFRLAQRVRAQRAVAGFLRDTPVLERAARDLAVVAAAAADARPARRPRAAPRGGGFAGRRRAPSPRALPELDAPRSPRRDDDALRDYLDGGGADRREATAVTACSVLAALARRRRGRWRALGRPDVVDAAASLLLDDGPPRDVVLGAARLLAATLQRPHAGRARGDAEHGDRCAVARALGKRPAAWLRRLAVFADDSDDDDDDLAARVDAAGDLLRAYGACAAELALVDDGAQPAGDGGVEDLVDAPARGDDAALGRRRRRGAAARATGRRGAARDYSLLADDAAAAVDAARPAGAAARAARGRAPRVSAVRHSGAVHAQDEERLMAARLHTLTETGEDCFLTSLRVRRGGAVAAAVAERLVRFCGANMHDPRHEATVLDAMETLATFLRFHAANHAASQLPADHGLTLSSPETLQPAACEVFDMIDTDGSGAITFEEIMDALQSNPYVFNFMNECGDERLASFCDPRTLASAFASIDGDGSNTISKKEWEAVVAEGVVGAGSPLARRAKRAWDASEAPKAQCVILLLAVSSVALALGGAGAGTRRAVDMGVTLAFLAELTCRVACWELMRPPSASRAANARAFIADPFRLVDVVAVALDLLFLGLDRSNGGARGARAVRVFKLVLSRVARLLEAVNPRVVLVRRNVARTRLEAEQRALAAAGGVDVAYGMVAAPQLDDRLRVGALGLSALLLFGGVEATRRRYLENLRGTDPEGYFFQYTAVDLLLGTVSDRGELMGAMASQEGLNRRSFDLFAAAARLLDALVAGDAAGDLPARELAPAAESRRAAARRGESYRGDAAAGGGLFRCVDAEGFAAEPLGAAPSKWARLRRHYHESFAVKGGVVKNWARKPNNPWRRLREHVGRSFVVQKGVLNHWSRAAEDRREASFLGDVRKAGRRARDNLRELGAMGGNFAALLPLDLHMGAAAALDDGRVFRSGDAAAVAAAANLALLKIKCLTALVCALEGAGDDLRGAIVGHAELRPALDRVALELREARVENARRAAVDAPLLVSPALLAKAARDGVPRPRRRIAEKAGREDEWRALGPRSAAPPLAALLVRDAFFIDRKARIAAYVSAALAAAVAAGFAAFLAVAAATVFPTVYTRHAQAYQRARMGLLEATSGEPGDDRGDDGAAPRLRRLLFEDNALARGLRESRRWDRDHGYEDAYALYVAAVLAAAAPPRLRRWYAKIDSKDAFWYCTAYDFATASEEIVGHALLLGVVACGVFASCDCFGLLLLEIVLLSSSLRNVTRAILRPFNELLVATYLMCVVCLVFTVVGLLAFQSLRGDDHYCKTVKECLFLNVYHGIVNGELVSVTKHVTNDAATDYHDLLMPSNAELKRMLLQLVFNIVVALLLLNMISGIILDAFTQETINAQRLAERRANENFATGLTRAQLEAAELDFAEHQALFSMRNYVHFVGYLAAKDPSIDSPVEAYVRAKNADADFSWIPLGTCFSLERSKRMRASKSENEVARLHDRLDAIAADQERRHAAALEKVDDLAAAVAALSTQLGAPR